MLRQPNLIIIAIRDRSSGVPEACTIAGRSLSEMVRGGAMSDISVSILPETPDDAVAIERLHERTFGPGRYAKSAYRLREQIDHIRELSFTAWIGSKAVPSGWMMTMAWSGRMGTGQSPP